MNNFCEECGANLSKGLRFCEACGHPVASISAEPDLNASSPPPQSPPSAFCEQCGTQITGSAHFCEACGHPAAEVIKPESGKNASMLRILAAGAGLLILGGGIVSLIWFFSTGRPSPQQLTQNRVASQKENLLSETTKAAAPPRPAPAPPGDAQKPPVPQAETLPTDANSQVLPAPEAPTPPALDPSGQFQVGSKWLIDWQSQFRYRGFLHIQQQLEANKYFGRITVSFANNKNVKKTVSMDGILTIRGKDVVINCSNPSESWWDTDDFYLERQNGTMTGYNLDKKGRRGKAVFVFADDALFATFLRQEFSPEPPAPRPPTQALGNQGTSGQAGPSISPQITEAEVHHFIKRYYQATAQGNLSELSNFYSDYVNYYAKGRVNKSYIKQDKENYYRRWPMQFHNMNGGLTITNIADGVKQVEFLTNFQVENNQKQVRGVAKNTWVIQKMDGRLAIIDEKSQVVHRE